MAVFITTHCADTAKGHSSDKGPGLLRGVRCRLGEEVEEWVVSGEGEVDEIETERSATEVGGEADAVLFGGAGEGLESSLRLFPTRGNLRGGHGRT